MQYREGELEIIQHLVKNPEDIEKCRENAKKWVGEMPKNQQKRLMGIALKFMEKVDMHIIWDKFLKYIKEIDDPILTAATKDSPFTIESNEKYEWWTLEMPVHFALFSELLLPYMSQLEKELGSLVSSGSDSKRQVHLRYGFMHGRQ